MTFPSEFSNLFRCSPNRLRPSRTVRSPSFRFPSGNSNAGIVGDPTGPGTPQRRNSWMPLASLVQTPFGVATVLPTQTPNSRPICLSSPVVYNCQQLADCVIPPVIPNSSSTQYLCQYHGTSPCAPHTPITSSLSPTGNALVPYKQTTMTLALSPIQPLPVQTVQWSPGTFPTVQWGNSVAQLDSLLLPNPTNRFCPSLVWDISHMPSTAKRLTCRSLFVNPRFQTLATSPATDHIHITCNGTIGCWMDYWGPIVISTPEVKVYDVLQAIYSYFQTRLTEDDFDRALALDPANEASLNGAFLKRIEATQNLTDYEIGQGLRRIDCLGDWRLFAGLNIAMFHASDYTLRWKLILEFAPLNST